MTRRAYCVVEHTVASLVVAVATPSTPERWTGWAGLRGWLNTKKVNLTHSSTNQAQHKATALIKRPMHVHYAKLPSKPWFKFIVWFNNVYQYQYQLFCN